MDKIESLKLNHPSPELIVKLNELGLSTSVPLSPDDLAVLDMYQI